MPEYAEKLIRRHCMRMLGNQFKLAMKSFVPQRRELERIIPDLTTELTDKMVVRVITDKWIVDRLN